MKKYALLALCAILISSLLSFTACKKEEYAPVDSTELEATEVMTFTLEGEKYSVRYELYRALFLSYKSEIDGGDSSVWTGENKSAYIKEIDLKIAESAARIYSALATAKKIGYDPYSATVDNEIKELIRISVEGGTWGGITVPGYDSYEDYLAALKDMNLNYSVQVLMYRYALAIEAIEDYYIGTVSSEDIDGTEANPGAIEYTKDTVEAFYNSDDCVRVLRMQLDTSYDKDPTERLARAKAAIEAVAHTGESAVIAAMIGAGSLTAAKEMQDGYVMAKHNLDRGVYGELTDAVFKLEPYEVSDAILVSDEDGTYHVIVYRADKSSAHFESCYSSIAYIYLKNEVGKILDTRACDLVDSLFKTEFLLNLDRNNISME